MGRKLTFEEFKKNNSYVHCETTEDLQMFRDWLKENNYPFIENIQYDKVGKNKTCHNGIGSDMKWMLENGNNIYTVNQLEWKKDSAKELEKDLFERTIIRPTFDFRPIRPLRFQNGYRGINAFDYVNNILRDLPMKEEKLEPEFRKVDFLNFNKEKGTTTIKFKNGNLVQSKVNPDEKFNEFTGLMVTLFKEVTGMSNQELQSYIKYVMRKERK